MKQLFLIVIIFAFASCKKDDGLPKDIPDCIKTNIEIEKQNTYGASAVTEYLFQGKIVYAVIPSNLIADAATEIHDESCKRICFIGGFGGPAVSQCNGENFFDKAVKKRVIWTR
jgi:hypothetical protein